MSDGGPTETLRRAGGWALPHNRWDLIADERPAALPTVSVVIAHYAQPRELARTLLALERQDYPRELVEIVVADDGSPEPPRVAGNVRVVTQPDRGFRVAAARNRGVEATHNEVLVFLDADTSPEPDYLRHIVRLPSLTWDAVTVGRRRHADFASVSPSAAIPDAGRAHEVDEPAWLREAYAGTNNLLDADHRVYRFVIGAVVACTRRFFDEVGGFDESFSRYGGEDWEWAYRAWLRGAVLAHVPEAVAWHDGPDRAVREPGALGAKNAEVLALADLIPVDGSRPRAMTAAKADIVITGPRASGTEGQLFVSRDSALAELPSAEIASDRWNTHGRFDRVRIRVELDRPVRVAPGGLADALAAVESGEYARVVLRQSDGTRLLRLVSTRAEARQNRWGGDPLLPDLELVDPGVIALDAEVDLEGYLGGWA
ncbi:glycosyltransferase [Conyzicola sp.]|uniref:glycosyltransferase n=1 Tax=Conyzicola sp. TaxID=1969404 RepID=UPI0039897664